MTQGELTISCVHSNVEPDYIEVRLTDVDAKTQFAVAKVSLVDFAVALMGRSYVACELDVRWLERVGKTMELDKLEVQMPTDDCCNRKETACEAVKSACPLGWTPDVGFNSHGSFFMRDGKLWARTTIRRWVAKDTDR
jgi:hypothetical protein